MNSVAERRVFMPNGRRDGDVQYNPLWCAAEHKKLDKKFDDLEKPGGKLDQIHQRINHLLYILLSIGVLGVANLLVSLLAGNGGT